MSNSKKQTNFTLKVLIGEEYKYLVSIMLYNSNNRIMENIISNQNEILYTLQKGLYTLRVEMNGDIKDEVILLDKDNIYKIENNNSSFSTNSKIVSPPEQFSSALLGETYASSHSYYTIPAIKWSKKETYYYNKKDQNSNSSLFIFLRFPSIEKYKTYKKSMLNPFYNDFELIDENGKVLIQFEAKKGIEVNEDEGWVAFNTNLSSGVYYLLYKGKEARQIPIYVYENWHTQFFITLADKPLFGTIRIFLAKEKNFSPKEKTYKYIDILLDKLQNQDYNLNNELIEMSAYGKYDSPMLGLVCSYIYLKSRETKSDSLFSIILENLQNVILKENEESPDFHALNILGKNHFVNYKLKPEKIVNSPMLRIGLESILSESILDKKLIPQNSVIDFISENLYYDSPFCTFKPFSFKKLNSNKNSRTNIELYMDNTSNLEDILDNSFIKTIKNENEFNIDNISKQIGVSFNTVIRILNQKHSIIKRKKYIAEFNSFGFVKVILESENTEVSRCIELKNYFDTINSNQKELTSLLKFLMRKKVTVSQNKILKSCLEQIIKNLKKVNDEKLRNVAYIFEDFFNSNEKNYRSKKISSEYIETIKDVDFLKLIIDYYGKRNYNFVKYEKIEEFLECTLI